MTIIAKGLRSIKYMNEAIAEELYALSKSRKYTRFVDLLRDIDLCTSLNSRQLDILIKLDFFSEFGNQRELLRIVDMFVKFKKGDAKQIKKAEVDGTEIEEIVSRYSVGTTKSGGIAKSYTLLDVMAILREIETKILSVKMDDLSDMTKVQNFHDVMGYIGYVSGKDSDRRKLYVLDVKPTYRHSDHKQFAYGIVTKSIGSGREARFTVVNHIYNKDPIKKGDIIYCKNYIREGQYFKLTAYEKVY